MQQNLSSGIFPIQLKFAEVKPILKKGDKKVTSNYIPISLLTSLSKIFEKIIYNRIFYHINYNHILINPSAWGHLIPSSYCDVGRFFYRVFKF